MYPPLPSHLSIAARAWRGVIGSWALVLMAGLFWCALQAQAQHASQPVASEGEMAYWVMDSQELEGVEAAESTLTSGQNLTCRKPVTVKPGVDLVLKEIADQDTPSCLALWPALPQAVPASGPQPDFPQTVRQPLLRPPALLG